MSNMNISIPSELVKMIDGKVASGLYNNASEVVCDALRQIDNVSEILYQVKLERLKDALAVGIEQARTGEFAEYSLQSVIAELNNKAGA